MAHLLKLKIEKILQEIAVKRGRIDLLALVDLRRDVVKDSADWERDGGGLGNHGRKNYGSAARIQIPYQPPEEYVLRVEFEARNCVIGLVHPEAQFMVELGMDVMGLAHLDGKRAMGDGENESTVRGTILKSGRNVVEIIVRKRSVTASVNQKKILEWSGDFKRLTNLPGGNYSVPNTKALFIANWGACKFTKMYLEPISGRGKKLR